MKHPIRFILAALVIIVALGVLSVSVETQDRRRGPARLTARSLGEVRQLDRRFVEMERSGQLVHRRSQPDTQVAGATFERLQQQYRKVPVWGGEVVREVVDGVPVSFVSTLYEGLNLDITPLVSVEEASAVFLRHVPRASGDGLKPELTIYHREDGTPVLTYRVSQFAGGKLPVLFVNARNGAIEHEYDNLQGQQPAIGQGTGVFGDQKKVSVSSQSGAFVTWDRMRPTQFLTLDMKGVCGRVYDLQDPGALPISASDLAVSSSTTWSDAVVVDAHAYLGLTYDYYYKRFGWKGLDNNNGRSLYVMVHAALRRDFETWYRSAAWALVGNFYLNSWFCGGCGYQGSDLVMLGEGLPSGWTAGGQVVDYAAGSIDTVSHEYSHGVTAYTSNLIYENESGALNESFSDIMSDSVEWFFQSPGTGVMKADYIHGEDNHRPSKPGSSSGIRSLANPSAYDCSVDREMSCPDHYSLRYLGRADGGGVHVNSSIPNHAFYLAIEGGTNRVSGLAVQGVGAANRQQIEKSFFRGYTTLPANATFSLARSRTIAAAQTLYGAGSPAERAITQAWSAVGVF